MFCDGTSVVVDELEETRRINKLDKTLLSTN